jgi:hypothetical protein
MAKRTGGDTNCLIYAIVERHSESRVVTHDTIGQALPARDELCQRIVHGRGSYRDSMVFFLSVRASTQFEIRKRAKAM